jgi:hypothetical protein
LRLFPDEGHHLLYRAWPEILASLLAPRQRAATAATETMAVSMTPELSQA